MRILVSSKRDEVLVFFLENPTTEIHLRQLSRQLGISLPWVRKSVEVLVRRGYVRKRTLGGLVLVCADRANPLFLALKRSYNICSLWECGLVDYLVESYGKPEAVVAYGPYSTGEDVETGEVDIAVVTARRVSLALARFERKLRKVIHILSISRPRIDPGLFSQLANGVVLSGCLQ